MEDRIYDVVICGAGVAGLSCAYKLLKANRNLSICVVEARDRVGGRTHTVKKGDIWCDVDVGSGNSRPRKQQKLALNLIRELGLELFTQFDDGDYVLQTENGVTYYDPVQKQNPLYAVELLTDKAQMLADNLSPEGYYEGKWTKEEKQLDSIMFSKWLEENQKVEGVGEFGVAATSAMITSAIACEPEEYSFLFFLSFLKSGQGYRTLIDVKDGVQEFRIKGGAQRISIEMQKFVEKRGCEVFYNEPVKSIANTNGTVLVTTRNGKKIRARHAVCAIPMNLVPNIEFSPPLPLERQQLCQKAPMGSAIKCIFFYKTAFWREKGLSANTVSLVPPLTNVFDAGDETGKYPALVCFLLGKNAKKWSNYTEERRRQDVVNQLADLFGEEAHDYVDVIEKNWVADEFSKGCYFCVPSVGVLSNYGFILRKSHGNVHFAGTETAKHYVGYIEGAIESGYRCSEEIQNRIEHSSKL